MSSSASGKLSLMVPYLNGIKAFEAAARGGGFAAAARELNVSAAAISRMVRLLENRLGVVLFERQAKGLALTAAGRLYQSGLTPIFASLVQLTSQVAGIGGEQMLTVGVGPTFAIRWLIPRLADFRREAPAIDVRITTGGAAAPFSDAWTCGVQLTRAAVPGLDAELLFTADLMPVCRPEVAAGLREPADLANAALLRVAHAPDDWPSWLNVADVPSVTAHGAVFEFYGQALQAAADGLGVALGIRPYIDDDIASGRLVAPFTLTVPKGMGWYLIYRDARRREPAFVVFRNWIVAAAVSVPAAPSSSPYTRPSS
jgi:LysR family transcriptional regulator, glycine cleavage system transcriptional activator